MLLIKLNINQTFKEVKKDNFNYKNCYLVKGNRLLIILIISFNLVSILVF